MSIVIDLNGLGISESDGHRITNQLRAMWLGAEPPHALRLTPLELAAMERDVGLRAACDTTTGGVSRETQPRQPDGDRLLPFELADPGPLRDQLVGAVLTGEKTATSSLLAQYHDEPLPRVGERFRVIDSTGTDVAVVETTQVRITRLTGVEAQVAIDEGEGFAGAEHWRRAHEEFWTHDPEIFALGIELSDETLVVVEWFRLVS